jgi:hypothetical protein
MYSIKDDPDIWAHMPGAFFVSSVGAGERHEKEKVSVPCFETIHGHGVSF